jgi:hypothetical protein
VRELILLRKASTGNRFQSSQEVLVRLVVLEKGVEGSLGELVIVSIVAKGCGALGKIAKIGLVLLVEERILSRKAVGNGFHVLGKATTR